MKMKKIFSFLISFIMTISCVSFNVFAESESGEIQYYSDDSDDVITISADEYDDFLKEHDMPVAGEDGFILPVSSQDISFPTVKENGFIAEISEPDPDAIVITTPEELAEITSGSYILGNDINLNKYNLGIWTPITPSGKITLDGQGHKVTNMYIPESSKAEYAGLFGNVEYDITIKNIGVEEKRAGITAVSSGNSGGLISKGTKSIIIENSYNNGDITNGSRVGGLVGSASDTITIENSYNNGDISNGYRIGGLIGYASNKIIIKNSYNNGDVNNSSRSYYYDSNSNYYYSESGGLIGYASNKIIIENSYNNGDVNNSLSHSYSSKSSSSGGLISRGDTNETIEVYNSYNSGNVTSTSSSSSYSNISSKSYSYSGGLIGNTNTITTIENSYNSGDIISTSSSSSYSDSYSSRSGDSYSYSGGLIGSASTTTMIDNSYNNGNITSTSSSSSYSDSVSGAGSSYSGGLIGYASDTITIENSYNSGDISTSSDSSSSSESYSYSGGLIGSASNIIIENSYNSGDITSTSSSRYNSSSSRSGGLIGYGKTVDVYSSYNSGDISTSSNSSSYSSSSYSGGLIGSASNITIENSYNSGDISTSSDSSSYSSSSYSGGLIGYASDTITIENSYNSGNVTSTSSSSSSKSSSYSGGLIGYASSKTQIVIKNFNFYVGKTICGSKPSESLSITYKNGAMCKRLIISKLPQPEDSVLKFDYENKEYKLGSAPVEDTLSAVITPHLEDKSGIKWESSNTDVVEIVSTDSTDSDLSDTLLCNIKCKAAGTSTITVTYTNGTSISASCAVTVKELPQPEDSVLKFDYESKEYEIGSKPVEDTLSAVITPHFEDKSGIKWESSNTDVVEIVNTNSVDGELSDTLLCNIKCKAAGTSTITVTYTNGTSISASCVITVKELPQPEDSVLKFDYESKEYEIGSKPVEDTLSAVITPHLEDKSGIKWESSNTDVVEIVNTSSVDGELSDTLLCNIKCKDIGTSTITVTYSNGASASCVVTVKDIAFGNVDGEIGIDVNDAVCLLQKVLDNSFEMPIEKKADDYMKYADVDCNGILTAADVAVILQKVLQNDFVMPIEKILL